MSQQEMIYEPELEHDYEEEPPVDANRETAAYHSDQVARYRDRIAKIEADFDARIEDLEARKRKATAALVHKQDWHSSAIEGWHRRAVADGQAEKTEHLPGMTSKLRAGRPKATVQDPEALRAWLHGRHDDDGDSWESAVFRREEKLMVSELTKRVKPAKGKKRPEPGTVVPFMHDGERVPGVVSITTGDGWSFE